MSTHACGRILAAGLVVVGVMLPGGRAVAGQAATRKTPVFVSQSGDDPVGVAFVESVKEALKGASTVVLSTSADDADVALTISTMNPIVEKPGIVTTVGWTLLVMKEATKAYIGGGLRLVDKERLQKGGVDLVTYIEGLLKPRAAELSSSPEREKLEAEWMDAIETAAAKLPEESCGVKVQAAFREQMRTYLLWTLAGSLKPDLQEAIKAATANLAPDEEFVKKMQAQAARLSQCLADVAALKKGSGAIKK